MTRGRKGERRQKGARKEIRKDLEQLLQKVEAAPEGTPELDREFAEIFSKAPPDVSTSIDAVVRGAKRAVCTGAPNRPRCAIHPSRNGSLAPSPAFCDRKFEIVTPTSRMPLGGGKTDRIRPRATSCSLSLVSMVVSIDRLRVDI
jgi:hypothetical protein